MSFLTHFLDTTPHFAHAIIEIEQQLKKDESKNTKRLTQLVKLAYCYAHVQLQKGVAVAKEAIELAEALRNETMKANALCAKAMNEFRIGYTFRAENSAQQALAIFTKVNDEGGMCDACFHLGCIPFMSFTAGDKTDYLDEAVKRYHQYGDKIGVYLARIQGTLRLFLKTKFEEGTKAITAIIKEISENQHKHLLCFANMQLSLGMYIKQDVVQFKNSMLEWQNLAEANGNFHDTCMTKAMLADCYRLEKINENAMEACLESFDYCDKLGSIHGHSTVAIVMATLCLGQSHYTDALFYLRKSITAALEIRDDYKYLMSLNLMGEIYSKSGQLEKARDTFQRVQRKAKLKNDRLNYIAASRHLAKLAYKQGEYDESLFQFKILCDDTENSDFFTMQDHGNYACSIAKASDAALQQSGLKPENRNSLRHHSLEKYLQLAKKHQNEREEAKALNSLAEYYEETDDLKKAIEYHRRYIQLYEKIITDQNTRDLTSLRLQYESEKKEQEIILLKKENEQSLSNERFRISRELHDDIGSTLGSISIYSEVAKNRFEKNENAEEAIRKIGNTSRELIDKMSDIVWSLNPNNESFEQLKSRVQASAAHMLSPHGINHTIIICGDMEQLKLTTLEIKNIYLIYKEAINNITKHAGCSQVDIKLHLDADELQLTIKDNGKGFDINQLRRTGQSLGGNGIKNMHSRAASIDGILNIEVIKNGGTTIELKLKV